MEIKTLALLSAGITIVIITFIGWVLWKIFFKQPAAPETEAETKKEKPASIPLADNPTIKNITYVVIIISTVVISTLALNRFLSENVLTSKWYWIIIGATAIICLIGWVQKKIQIESANTICKIVLSVSILMLILNTVWPWTTLPELKERWSKHRISTAQLQILPQISYGWKVDSDGNLIANLKPGKEATRPFHLAENQSTPWVRIPQDNYRFRFTNLQTVIVDDGYKTTVVHPKDYYDMGIVTGERKLRFSALKGGAELTLHIKRL